MHSETLDFEKPIVVLLKEIQALSLLPRTAERQREIEQLRARVETVRREIYAHLTPWQRVLVARHPNRPNTLDYVARLFTEFTELHGDRRFGDDHAVVAGFAFLDGRPVLVVGHQKGSDTKPEDLSKFWVYKTGGLPEGPPDDEVCGEVRSPDYRVRGYTGSLSRDRVRGAGGRRGDCCTTCER